MTAHKFRPRTRRHFSAARIPGAYSPKPTSRKCKYMEMNCKTTGCIASESCVCTGAFQSPVCSSGSQGDACCATSDCHSTDSKFGYCLNQSCSLLDKYGVGKTCTDNTQCQTSRCVESRCRRNDASCDSLQGEAQNPDCQPNQLCQSGRCVEPPHSCDVAKQTTCATDNECKATSPNWHCDNMAGETGRCICSR